jgi:hypothetical protein
MTTGLENVTCCQPLELSPVNVASASGVPSAAQRLPM